MANSLQEQLLKAGLVDQKKVKKVKAQKHKEVRQQKGGKAPPPDKTPGAIQQAQAEKAARDRELNQRRQEEAKRREIAAQIRQIVQQNRVDTKGGEEAYNFVDGGKLKKLFVTPELRQGLAKGRYLIVRCDGRYELLAAEAAAKVRERDPNAVIENKESDAQGADDEYYAKFEVPDDLTW